MKCVVLLVMTTIFCQFGRSTTAVRQRRGYFERPRNHDYFHGDVEGGVHHGHHFDGSVHHGRHDDGPDHPDGSWWRDRRYHRPSGPHNPFGFPHGDFSGDKGARQQTDFIPDGGNIGKPSSPWGLQTTDKSYLGNLGIFPLNKDRPPVKTEQIESCIRSCSVTSEYNPVCGSNNMTYQNPGRLECAQTCGVEVQLSRLTACTAPVETNPDGASKEVLTACLRQCPVTTEYNPVCGTDNITYVNYGRLICAQNCGVQVELRGPLPCLETFPEPTTTERNEQEILTCIRSCPVTGEYNPVCGSNNVTYTNFGRLECAQRCGLAVTVSRETSCSAPLTTDVVESVINKSQNTTEINQASSANCTTARPFTNENSKAVSEENATNKSDQNLGNNINGDNNLNSENNDNKAGEKDSGNGDNGNDGYDTDQDDNLDNNDAPIFAKGIYGGGGYGGNNAHASNAHSGNYGGHNGHGGNSFHSGHGGNHGNHRNNCNGANNQKTPNVQKLMECMQICTLTSELNPVCGTDGITYTNPGRLLCAQFCGIDVKVKKFAPCSYTKNTYFYCPSLCPSTAVTDNPTTTDTPLSPTVQTCMDACPASTEFKPVCGTNNITYRNLEKMQCARRCGIDVSLFKNTNCSAPDATSDGNPPVWTNTEIPTDPSPQIVQECIKQCSVPQNYDPICGSDNVTYNNTGHLICARQCGIDIRVKYLTPCSDDKSPSPKPTTENVPVVSTPKKSNVTISSDILAALWPELTSTTPKDDSEDFNIDIRIGDD